MEHLIVASVTPFTRENQIHEAALKALWERNLSEGADGFFVGGSSGECFLLSETERLRTFELAAEYGGRAEIFAHAGALSTDQAVFLAKRARELGIERIAATPPFYFAYSPREIARYYDDLAQAAGGPVLYYNIPSSTHRSLDLDHPDIQAMFRSGAIGAVKHTNLNLYEMERIRNLNPDIRCYGGFESSMVAFLGFGCDGFIGSSFNFMLPQFRQILKLCHRGEAEEARRLQSRSNNILDVILREGLCASLKYILNRQGIDAGQVRRPMLPLGPKAQEAVDRALEENLLIK